MPARSRRRGSGEALSRLVRLYKTRKTSTRQAPKRRKSLDPPSSFVYSYWTVRASHDPRRTVGLIGLGNMGTAIAERLLDGGYELLVVQPDAGEGRCARAHGARPSPKRRRTWLRRSTSCSRRSPTTTALEAVAGEVVAAARPGTVLVDMSTVSPAASARVASLADDGVRSPTCAHRSAATRRVVRAGNLSFIVSGPAETLERRRAGHPSDRPHRPPRRRRRAGSDREARDQPHDRRARRS